MSTERYELAEVIDNSAIHLITGDEQIDAYIAADAVLAAGYRKPRTITTAAELDALPVDTAIIGTSRIPNKWPGAPYAKAPNGEWYDYANEYHVESEDVLLPATITFEPEPES